MYATEKNSKEVMTVYPGIYSPPVCNLNEEISELQKKYKEALKPVVNISEYKEYYKVEFLVPGHTKEDFIISIYEDKLTMVVLQPAQPQEQYTLHEFSCECFSYTMQLPANTDTNFISAQYNAGILCMLFPKAEIPVENIVHSVVVY